MKSLAISFVIVGAIGSMTYLVLSSMLKAEGFAGALTGLLFGTLPLIHQELEKREAKKTRHPGAEGVAYPLAPQHNRAASAVVQSPRNAPRIHSPKVQIKDEQKWEDSIPIYAPPVSSPASPTGLSVSTSPTSDAAPPLVQPSEGVEAQHPVPVQAPPPIPLPVSAPGPYPYQERNAVPTKGVQLISWPIMLVYSFCLSIAAGSLFWLLVAISPIGTPGGSNNSANASWVALIVLILVGGFATIYALIGRWIALHCEKFGLLVLLIALFVGLPSAITFPALLLGRVDASNLATGLGQSLILMLFVLPFSLLGYWWGHRTRNKQYLNT